MRLQSGVSWATGWFGNLSWRVCHASVWKEKRDKQALYHVTDFLRFSLPHFLSSLISHFFILHLLSSPQTLSSHSAKFPSSQLSLSHVTNYYTNMIVFQDFSIFSLVKFELTFGPVHLTLHIFQISHSMHARFLFTAFLKIMLAWTRQFVL